MLIGCLLGLILPIIFAIILFFISPILSILWVALLVGTVIYACKNGGNTSRKGKNTSRKGGSSLLFSLAILDDVGKCVKNAARPQYGRYGRRSIQRRKRRK